MLLVVTFRPEFQPPWTGQPHVTAWRSTGSANARAPRWCERLAGNAALPAEIVDEIVERTDGVPLFVEELTKAVLERPAGRPGRRGAGNDAACAALSVPATLHASLMARLDRLGPAAKEVAQVGAVIGREFSYELLGRSRSVPERGAAERRSISSSSPGWLFRRGTPPQATYLFKHALVQDAAYGTLLRGAAAGAARAHRARPGGAFRRARRSQPELLAHHLTEAGDRRGAVDTGEKAGEQRAARARPTRRRSRISAERYRY